MTVIPMRRPERGRDKVRLVVSTDLETVVDEALRALCVAQSEVYVSGGVLVQRASDTVLKNGEASRTMAPRLEPIGPMHLRELVSSAAEWHRLEKRGRPTKSGDAGQNTTECMPPMDMIHAIMQRGEWSMLRRTTGITEVPVLAKDGSVNTAPGYDPKTELIYDPNAEYDIPKTPTHKDALRARDELLDAVCDFPFASEAHKAAWLACALTPFARHSYDGPAPLFAFDANVRGSGKSLLGEVAAHIACGRPVPRQAPSTTKEEEDKMITTKAIEGARVIFIDNVSDRVGGSSLEAALTSCWHSGRILGSSKMWSGAFAPTWIATGNNMRFTGDMCRRVCHVRLEASDENPEDRTEFKRPRLLEWLKDNAPRLASAALTILSAYCAADRPRQKVRSWGSYEGWVDLVASAVAWVGMPDPSETRQELMDDADDEKRVIGAFLSAFHEHATWGMTANELVADCQNNKKLADTVAEFVNPRRGEAVDAVLLGNRIARIKNRVVSGMFIKKIDERGHRIVWGVKKA